MLAHDPAAGLSGERDEEFEKAWSQWQQDLSHLSTNSSLAVAEGSGHEIQTEQPQLVIGEMLKVVAEVHSHLGS